MKPEAEAALSSVVDILFDDIHQQILERLRNAQSRIYVASYLKPSDGILEELGWKSSIDVDVQLAVSAQMVKQEPAVIFPVFRVSTERGTMHHKFIVVDDTVIVGSANLTHYEGGRNVMVVLDGPYVVQEFVDEFMRLKGMPKLPEVLRGDDAILLCTRAREVCGYDNEFLRTVQRRCTNRGWLTLSEQRRLQKLIQDQGDGLPVPRQPSVLRMPIRKPVPVVALVPDGSSGDHVHQVVEREPDARPVIEVREMETQGRKKMKILMEVEIEAQNFFGEKGELPSAEEIMEAWLGHCCEYLLEGKELAEGNENIRASVTAKVVNWWRLTSRQQVSKGAARLTAQRKKTDE